jgi:ribosomal protein L20
VARTKGGIVTRRRHNKILRMTRGMWGTRHRLFPGERSHAQGPGIYRASAHLQARSAPPVDRLINAAAYQRRPGPAHPT